MSFYELFALFYNRRRFFGGVLGTVWLVVTSTYFFQPAQYEGELWLTVTRTQGTPSTSEYTYDQFYRFQADERLADSLVAFLVSESGKRLISEKAKFDEYSYQKFLKGKINGMRQGTNAIKVSYRTTSLDQGAQIGEAVLNSANTYLFAINEDAHQPGWFTVVGMKPALWDASWSLERLGVLGLVSGLVVAFWGVVLRFFWDEYRVWQSRKRGE
ncbi:hypothetical protein E6Q11_01530 [Candidatus Dojkabacteria bacterium]|uniref:Polysaccharide chain length determinant N-terminal domain-containing protein n=1 Tax=Candidatus Dojkabacteria bacterium TaxID=2099670 RepID=A0A5C7J9Y4_9BACT|nr:MAG: hypothetical protein E6Q11_01530 [Candidatus Dojkabacteria bacterium]